MRPLRSRVKLTVVAIAAPLLLLTVMSYLLSIAGITVSLSMGASDIKAPHIVSGFPLDVQVVYRVRTKEKGNNTMVYVGVADFVIKNDDSDPAKLHFPLVRAMSWTPTSTQFVFLEQLDEEWKRERIVELMPGQEFTVTVPVAGILFDARERLLHRWGLVFSPPSNEDPDEFVAGTIVTQPIRWQNEDPG